VSALRGQPGQAGRLALAGACLLVAALSWSLAGTPRGPGTSVGPVSAGAESRAAASRSGPRHGRSSRWGLTEAQRAELVAFAKEHMPEQHQRLVKLLEDDPRRAGWLLWRLYRLYVGVRRYPPEVRRAAIARHQVRVAIYRAVRELRQARTAEQRQAVKARLADLLGQEFDHEQVVRDYEVKRLAEQVADLAAEIKRRRTDRAGVIEERLRRLLAARPGAKSRPVASRPSHPTSRPATGWPRHARRSRLWRKLSPEQAGEVLEYARQHLPELHKRLVKLRRRDPGRVMVTLEHLHGLVRRLRSMPAEVRDAAIVSRRLNVSIFSVARRAREAKDPAERKRRTAELRELLARQLQADQVVKEYRAKRLGRQLADLKAGMEARRRERAKIIAERLERLSRPQAVAPARPGARR